MRHLDTVIFDLDDTLHDDSTTFRNAALFAARDTAAAHRLDPVVLGETYVEVAMNYWRSITNDELRRLPDNPRQHMWAAALERFGLRDPALALQCATAFQHHRNALCEPFPGALRLLESLRERGIKLGMITNGFAVTHRDKIALLGLGHFFDGIFLADEVGLVKPDPRIFQHACDVLGSEPANSAMVGDRYDRDIIGAAEIGMFTVLVNYHRLTLEPGMSPPDVTVDTIDEVGAVLPLAGSALT